MLYILWLVPLAHGLKRRRKNPQLLAGFKRQSFGKAANALPPEQIPLPFNWNLMMKMAQDLTIHLILHSIFFQENKRIFFKKRSFFCRIETRIRKIGILKIPQFFANFSFFIGWSINFIFSKNNSFGSKLNIRERLWMNDVCQFVWPLAVWPQESTVALKCNPVIDRNSQ